MIERLDEGIILTGGQGVMPVRDDDEITIKLAMLFEGECEGKGATECAKKFGYSRQRYHQLLNQFFKEGALGLKSRKRGPKSHYRRTDEVVRQIIRYRFLDPELSGEVIAQKLIQTGHQIAARSVERVIEDYGLQKKKLHLKPSQSAEHMIETHRTKEKVRKERCDARSIERQVRQLLADKISGNLVGVWLLIPEYLRLGIWDLLKSWTGAAEACVEPRLGLQLVNEAALCVNGIRQKRTLSQKGFELANGLPFVATDAGIHFLLDTHTVAQAQRLQIALGKIRSTFGHFKGQLLAIDGHPIESYSKRQMVRRRIHKDRKACKVAQTIFCLDAETYQPVCFVTGTSARTATDAAKELLNMSAQILKIEGKPLVVADTEHYTAELYEWVRENSPFDLMTPVSSSQSLKRVFATTDRFEAHWAGYGTTKRAFQFKNGDTEPFCQFIQRKGERKEDYDFRAFLCTSDRDQLGALSEGYPGRWHIEEFFKLDQALGWHRAGTMNLNIRYGKMTMSLLAQAALHMLRQRSGDPVASWDSQHFADGLLKGLEGDIRVKNDTIMVTYYNAPNSELLKKHYEQLPQILADEGVSANIPWLYDFKLDFRFK